MGKTFADVETASKFREVIIALIGSEVARLGLKPTLATVTAVNGDNTITVQYPNEATGTAKVRMSVVRPSTGDVVRVAGLRGDRYVVEVLTPGLLFTVGGGSPTIGGDLKATTSTTGYQAMYRETSTGQWAKFTSMRRLKKNIRDLADTGFDRLRPRAFEPLHDSHTQYGFIADEAAEADRVFGTYEDGEPVGWSEPAVIAALVLEVQQLKARVAELEANRE